MLVIASCAVICGADGWVQLALFGRSKLQWFSSFLELPSGTPSHDTFGRVFARLDPDALEARFTAWINSLAQSAKGKLVAIDGKAIRRSFEHAWDKSGMAHLVSAFVGANRLVFGQLAVENKENEIVAIPRLLELLDLHGAMVTIDAMGCQKAIARKIVDKGGDYLLALKENQLTLHQKVKALLDEAILEGFGGMEHDACETTDGDHGRIETRRCWSTGEIEHLGEWANWPGLKSLAVVESRRELIGQEPGMERRYYLCSLESPKAAVVLEASRGHWSVENQLHYLLDVSFNEDQRRLRKGRGAENFSRLCRLALNLLQQEKTRVGIKSKRLLAGWDHDYLLRLLSA
jgi:predicted transposase YbfD/YdcC